jgi:hypothetical protein
MSRIAALAREWAAVERGRVEAPVVVPLDCGVVPGMTPR